MNEVPEWRTLGECLEYVVDNRGKTPPLADKRTIYELLEVNALKGDGKWPVYSEVRKFVDKETYESWFRKGHPQPGDVLFSTVGSIAEVALSQGRGCIAQNVVGLRGKASHTYGPFLYYALRNPIVKNQLMSLDISSVQPSIKVPHLLNIELPWPSYKSQQSIAHILGTLDDKIELNRQINTTLESMAQALFKSWFVDFDPVIDNALAAGNDIPEPLQAKADKRARQHVWTSDEDARRASATEGASHQRKPLPDGLQQQFPDRFVFTEEMGWVPEGWKTGTFRDIASHIRENVKVEEVATYDCYVGLEHIGRKQLFLSEFGTGEAIESNKSRFQARDLLFGKLRAYFHKVCLASKEGICSTDILVFRAKEPCFYSLMVMTAYSSGFVEYADLRSTGTRMPRANAKDLLDYPVVVPEDAVGEAFENQVSPIWERGQKAVSESRELSLLRDTLLPKLLSGELRIPEVEKQVAEAV